MKTIIAGSRGITKMSLVVKAVQESGFDITEVVSGGARGVDRLGEDFAKSVKIGIKQFIPDWDGLGKKAGYVRNADMAAYGEALVAIWDGESRGTLNMIRTMEREGKPVHVLNLKDI